MKLSDRISQAPKILLYGKPGSGKTAHVLTLGSGLQVLDLDDGLVTGVSLKDFYRKNRLNIDYISCLEDDADKGVAFAKAHKAVMIITRMCREGNYPYQALSVDSLTMLQQSAMRWVQGNNGTIGKNPTQPEWGLAHIQMRNIITLLRGLPIAVFVVAHEYNLENDDGMPGRSIEVAIQGRRLPSELTSQFDEIWRYKIEGSGGHQRFVIQTKGTGSVLARSRYNLGDAIPLNMTSMVEIMRECGYDWKVGENDLTLEQLDEHRKVMLAKKK